MKTAIHYLKGDATEPVGEDNKIIVHVCNDVGAWGYGFVMALSKKWKEPELKYRHWFTTKNNFALGEVQLARVENKIWVANLIGQHKLTDEQGVPPVRYEAIKSGLEKVATFAAEHQASVHMPRIGCGLAGGTWDRIDPLIEETLLAKRISVFVYDL